MRAAQPLIAALRKAYPDAPVLLTCMTPTGRATAESLVRRFRAHRLSCPTTTPGSVRRFLRRVQPRVGILMETELWPNLIHAAARADVPLVLANARLSARSARGYARLRGLTRACLERVALVAAQAEADAARLRSLGAMTVHVTGNLKFDIAPPPDQLERGAAWKAAWGQRPVLLAASTREGEEALLLRAFAATRAGRRAAGAGAASSAALRRGGDADRIGRPDPSAPQRAGWNASCMRTHACCWATAWARLFAYYAACDVAFVGGSLLPLGGQNLIEAASVGRPVLVGPHTFNFEEATRLAIEAGAALRVNDAR